MSPEKKFRFIVEVVVNEDEVTDSPYYPLAASGRTFEGAIAALVQAEIQSNMESLKYIEHVRVKSTYD